MDLTLIKAKSLEARWCFFVGLCVSWSEIHTSIFISWIAEWTPSIPDIISEDLKQNAHTKPQQEFP